MELRLSIVVAPAAAAALSLVAGCGDPDDSPPPDTGDFASGGSDVLGQSSGTGGVVGGAPAAGASAADGTIEASFDTLEFIITRAPCFGSGCHNDAQNPLDLRVDDALLTRLTSHISENCGNIPVVSPGDPGRSAIVKILRGPCGKTPRMPDGCVDDANSNCVPAEYIDAIERWIAIGAPQR